MSDLTQAQQRRLDAVMNSIAAAIELDFNDDTLPPEPAEAEGRQLNAQTVDAAELFADSGFSTIQIPGPLLCFEDYEIWRRVLMNVRLKRPPQSDPERLIRLVCAELPGSVSRGAVITGVRLAIARIQGVQIQTHPRDLAKDLQVRYSTLLRIRRLALLKAQEMGYQPSALPGAPWLEPGPDV